MFFNVRSRTRRYLQTNVGSKSKKTSKREYSTEVQIPEKVQEQSICTLSLPPSVANSTIDRIDELLKYNQFRLIKYKGQNELEYFL